MIPHIALSVRQPWAWAIIHAGKEIENRTLGSIRAGGMTPGRVAIHAASGLSQKEYRWGQWRLERHGVRAPRPHALIRSAIIGHVEVVDIVDQSDSEWFGGPWGLVLRDPVAIDPIPAKGALGYFRWSAEGAFAPPKPWMLKEADRDEATLPLFDDLASSFAEMPQRPSRSSRK